MEKQPIHPMNSSAYDALLDFTKPFMYRTTSDLNTTSLFVESGEVDTYFQDGYALDIVPNVAPNVLATFLQECEGILNQSLAVCMTEQNVFPSSGGGDGPTSAPTPPPPPITSTQEPVIVIFTDSDDNYQPTDPAFRLERTIILNTTFPEHEVQFQLKNNGVLVVDWEAKFYNGSDTLLERWQDDVLWISEDLNNQGTLECTADICDAVRLKITVRAGQVNYLLTDQFVQAGQVVHAPNSPLDIVFRGIDPWESKSATLRLNVFLDRTESNNRRHLSGVPELLDQHLEAAEASSSVKPQRRRKLQQDMFASPEACTELAEVPQDVPVALVTDECTKIPDDLDLCKLDEMSFQQMYRFTGSDFCSGCACKEATDEECVEHCSPKRLFISQVEALEQGAWLDKHTRAVILDVSLFNTNYNLFSTVRCVAEFQATGYVHPTVGVRTFKLYRYQTSYDYFIGACEVMFILLVLFYIYEEIVEITRQKWSYFSHGWNYVDWANLLIALSVILLRIVTLAKLNGFTFNSTSVFYVDFPPLGYFARMEVNVSAVNFFIIYFKIFKYLENVPRMNTILKTLSAAVVDIALFLVLVIIVYFGFTCAFFICFGMQMYNFRTFGDSFGALSRMVLGDFDYPALVATNAIMTRILFYSFVLVVVFVVLSMFLALVSDAYEQQKLSEPPAPQLFASITARLFRKRDNVAELKDALIDIDADGDQRVDMFELRRILAGNTKALAVLQTTTVQELMEKYDVDDDGELDQEELLQILAEVAEKEAQIAGAIEVAEHQAALEAEAEVELTAEERAAKKNWAKLQTYNGRIGAVSTSLKELSKNVAKKLSTMIDLMVSLSSHVSSDIPSTVNPPSWHR